jgi:hypothetical protein
VLSPLSIKSARSMIAMQRVGPSSRRSRRSTRTTARPSTAR